MIEMNRIKRMVWYLEGSETSISPQVWQSAKFIDRRDPPESTRDPSPPFITYFFIFQWYTVHEKTVSRIGRRREWRGCDTSWPPTLPSITGTKAILWFQRNPAESVGWERSCTVWRAGRMSTRWDRKRKRSLNEAPTIRPYRTAANSIRLSL